MSAAADLPRLDLDQALLVCLAYLAQGDRHRYERAVVRWHARYCDQHRPALPEAQLVLSALGALGASAPARDGATDALAACFAERGMTHARDLIERWADGALVRSP